MFVGNHNYNIVFRFDYFKSKLLCDMFDGRSGIDCDFAIALYCEKEKIGFD